MSKITKFASSTALHQVTPAENVIIFGKNKVLWLFGLLTWIVDYDYMSIPQCYDILKKLLSNCDSWKGLSEPLCGSVNMIWGKRGPTKFMVRLCFAFKIQPQASFGEPRSTSNANKHATFRGQHRYLHSHNSGRVLVLAPKRNPSFRPFSAFSDSIRLFCVGAYLLAA